MQCKIRQIWFVLNVSSSVIAISNCLYWWFYQRGFSTRSYCFVVNCRNGCFSRLTESFLTTEYILPSYHFPFISDLATTASLGCPPPLPPNLMMASFSPTPPTSWHRAHSNHQGCRCTTPFPKKKKYFIIQRKLKFCVVAKQHVSKGLAL